LQKREFYGRLSFLKILLKMSALASLHKVIVRIRRTQAKEQEDKGKLW
jgi:hypothetical protein